MNSYENFNNETKLYLNKAMDIYSNIMEKKICKKVCNRFNITEQDYVLKKMDKRILSLYIAGFLVNGDLKNILEEYDDIRIEALLSFVNLNDQEIKSLKKNEYSEFYNRYFKFDLISMLDEKTKIDKRFKNYKFNEITPEIIFICMNATTINNCEILNYLCTVCNLKQRFLYNHPSFLAVENFVMEKSNFLEKKNKSIAQEQNLYMYDFNDDKFWNILDNIKKKFVGQESATEYLFYNIVNNQYLALKNDVFDGERAIIFLDGPTGTGKTAIIREIVDKLDIPFTLSSITNYSAVGYEGGNITNTLQDLYKKANYDIQKAQRGIVVFDEFDKIAYAYNKNGLEMKRAVQQELLDFIGAGKYNITVKNDTSIERDIEFDTSKLTFICLGALTKLRNSKEKKDAYTIMPQDLFDIGLERELVARFNTYLHTEEYSRGDLLNILTNSTISPMIGFQNWIISRGKKLVIEDGVYEVIADAAYDLDSGARSLQTMINNIRTFFIKDVLRGKEEVIYLNVDAIININRSMFVRKVKRKI